MKKDKKNIIDKFLESKLGKLIGIFAIAYFILQAFGVNLSEYNIIFKFLIVYAIFIFFAISLGRYINKKIKELKVMLSDIRIIKNLKKNIDKIKKEQEKDRVIIKGLLKLKNNLEMEIMRIRHELLNQSRLRRDQFAHEYRILRRR